MTVGVNESESGTDVCVVVSDSNDVKHEMALYLELQSSLSADVWSSPTAVISITSSRITGSQVRDNRSRTVNSRFRRVTQLCVSDAHPMTSTN